MSTIHHRLSSLALLLSATVAVACTGGTGAADPSATPTGSDEALSNGGKTFIVSATVDYSPGDTSHLTVTPSIGFSSDVSDGVSAATAFCYVGNANDVCQLIHDYEKSVSSEVTGDYDNGAITVQSCDAVKNVVTVSWSAIWDRHPDQHFTKKIEACAKAKN